VQKNMFGCKEDDMNVAKMFYYSHWIELWMLTKPIH